ncbi:MAG TPA: hypothetical protein VM120_02160 [Bryobacteraceae bacterium]|nr:hypothetical protein [Bryobacteraceae bacterium]
MPRTWICRSVLAFFAALLLLSISASAQSAKPISKKGLIDALKIGGLTQQEMVQFVKQRGVDFKATPVDEGELRAAGASQELLTAVKASFRAPAVEPASSKAAGAKPLSKTEIVTLLQVGTPSPRIIQLAKDRGISFRVTPDVRTELENAGADSSLVGAVSTMPSSSAPAAAPSKKLPVMQRALTPEQAAAPPPAPENPLALGPAGPPESADPPSSPVAPIVGGTPKVSSLREVKIIFIDKMPNDLDQFLRAEISKQMAGRLAVTLMREDADAILTGVSDAKTGTGSTITGRYLGLHDMASGAVSVVDSTGTKVLWSDEAGDRSLVFGIMKRGGQRKAADRLISKLRQAMN